MKVELLSLELKNFKGIKSFELDANGKNLTVYGQNEAGKTTLADGFSWLLFDKDTKDQSTQKFQIKPLDEDNEPIHGLETTAKATLRIDDSQLTLKKIYKEVWQKKRGSSLKQFQGHTTDYYISGAPCKKKEYDTKINEIVDEEIFRLLTDPLYFNTQLHWKERRDVLMQLCDGVDDEDVLSANQKLDELSQALEKRDIEKHKSVLKNKMDKLDEDIEDIPTRIDEVSQGLPDVSDYSAPGIRDKIESLKKKKKSKELELSRVENGGEVAEKKKQLTEIETEMQKIKNNHAAQYEKKISDRKKQISSIKDEIREIEHDIKNNQSDIEDNLGKIARLGVEKERLANKWHEKQKEKKELTEESWQGDTICPTCGQELPEEQIEEAKAKYNRDKAEKIEELEEDKKKINEDGKSIVSEIEDLQLENEKIENGIDELEKRKEDWENESTRLEERLQDLKEKYHAYGDDEEYKKKREKMHQVREEMVQLKENNKFSLQRVDKEITALEEKIETEQQKLQDIKSYNQGQKRIEELKKEERDLNKKYEELEREMALCEQFEQTRAELIEEQVNDRFKLASFKLFETQINGGIKPTCKTLYNGVPYNTNLNGGHKIRVGIDIIDTLAEHYDFRAPVFVDNAEAVTGEIETESQLIQLVAKEGVKELEVEEVN